MILQAYSIEVDLSMASLTMENPMMHSNQRAVTEDYSHPKLGSKALHWAALHADPSQ